MCNPIVIPIAIAAAGALVKGYGAIQGGQAAQQAADAQRKSALYQEGDALQRGAVEAGDLRTRGTQVAGAQRAALAASGVDLSSGTAQNLFSTTAALNEQDVSTARANASREAWGHAYEATQAQFEKKMAKRRTVLGVLGAGIGGAQDAYSGYMGAK